VTLQVPVVRKRRYSFPMIRALTAAACAVLGIVGISVPTAAHGAAADGVTVGYAVFDRTTGSFTAQSNATTRFRSASIVKLLIALDYLWDRGTPDAIPAADRRALDAMLRSSDDNAASDLWDRGGSASIVNRMVARLGLQNTAAPPAPHDGYWGYTATSPADTVRVYRHVLDGTAAIRDYVMGQLRQSTRCASDQFDQSFGIRSAYAAPWAVKQGWSGFGSRGDCDGNPADPATSAPGFEIPGLDLIRPALHTTGTAGPGDRSIVAVFSLHPVGTSFGAASTTLTAATRALPVAGATPVDGTWFGTWGSRVKVRAAPTTQSRVVGTLPAGIAVAVRCQQAGEVVDAEGYRNEWWAYLPERGGYLTNIYMSSPDNKLPGVPDCQ
jgi:beta-lactamase family protein